MKDFEHLTPSAAYYVKGVVELAQRQVWNNQLTEAFQTLGKLQLDCIRALEVKQSSNKTNPTPGPRWTNTI